MTNDNQAVADLYVEARVIAEGLVNGVIEGRKYNRAVRLHKLVYEALLRLAWKGFLPWLEEHHARDVHHLEETLKDIASFHDSVSQGALQELLEDKSCTRCLKSIWSPSEMQAASQHFGCPTWTWLRSC